MANEVRSGQPGALRILAEIAHRCQGTLYVRSGPQQLFERLELSAGRRFEHSWLYIPSQYLHLLREQIPDGVTTPAWLDPLPCDEGLLYPVACGRDTVAMLTTPDHHPPQISDDDRAAMQAAICTMYKAEQPDVHKISATFVRELFHRDSSAAQFTKRFFGLLTSEWHRSCAGLYAEHEGVYQLRLATGDVSRWFCLPRQLHPDATMHYLEAMYRQECFMPAEFIQDYPVFLDTPPDFMFIHEGILSERSRQLMVLAGPGTIATLGVNCIQEYMRLLGELHELQFTNGIELLKEYEKLSTVRVADAGLSGMLTDALTWLTQQMSVTQLGVMLRRNDGSWAPNTVVHCRHDGEPEVESGNDPGIPGSILSLLEAGEQYHLGDIRQSELSEQQGKQRYLRGVISEIYLPLKSPDGVMGALVVGSGAAGQYLTDCDELLQALAGYVSLWLQRAEHQRSGPLERVVAFGCTSAQLP